MISHRAMSESGVKRHVIRCPMVWINCPGGVRGIHCRAILRNLVDNRGRPLSERLFLALVLFWQLKFRPQQGGGWSFYFHVLSPAPRGRGRSPGRNSRRGQARNGTQLAAAVGQPAG